MGRAFINAGCWIAGVCIYSPESGHQRDGEKYRPTPEERCAPVGARCSAKPDLRATPQRRSPASTLPSGSWAVH